MAASLLAWGCVTAPPEWRVSAEQGAQHACGSFVHVNVGRDHAPVRGELMAVNSDEVFVRDDHRLYSIPREIVKSTMTIYADSWDGTTGLWTAIGTLHTFHQGWLSLLSAPVWLIGGLATTAAERSAGRERSEVPSLYRARYPQGMPGAFSDVVSKLSRTKLDAVSAPDLEGACPPN